MILSGLLTYPDKFQVKIIKILFPTFKEETTFQRFSSCGTSLLFLATIPTLSGLFRAKQI
jgi:hypothetical protein